MTVPPPYPDLLRFLSAYAGSKVVPNGVRGNSSSVVALFTEDSEGQSRLWSDDGTRKLCRVGISLDWE